MEVAVDHQTVEHQRQGRALCEFDVFAPPRFRVNKILGALSVAIGCTGIATAALAQARAGTTDIMATLRSPNSVHVEERYTLGPSAASIELQALTRPCVVIENMRIERNGAALAVPEARKGRWITWRDTTPAGGDSIRLFVRYHAWLGGSGALPLVHLAAPLARNASSRHGAVTVTIRFARAGRVDFPHMGRQSPNEWSGRYIATPSFVKVGDANRGCDVISRAPGDNGGLTWRFALLVGIMVAWVPLYLAWARRTGDRG